MENIDATALMQGVSFISITGVIVKYLVNVLKKNITDVDPSIIAAGIALLSALVYTLFMQYAPDYIVQATATIAMGTWATATAIYKLTK